VNGFTLDNGEYNEPKEKNLEIGDLVRCKSHPTKIGMIQQKAMRESNILMRESVMFYKIKWFDWDLKHDLHWWMIGALETIVKNQKNV
tara:strand:+ start:304 stop:567 length:264 start_codon:yes stop_codon:yes gene_type:complete